jgi:hypothetical protein
MKTLGDAWEWYNATKQNLARMRRLGEKHWDSLASLPDASVWHDDHFKWLEAGDIEAETAVSLRPIDDLAVVLLFSVFESRVRDYLIELIEPQAHAITHPILKEAADDAIQGVREGSFYRRVLDPLKKQSSLVADLVTQVDQVRDYRNWVAHGRRDAPTNNVTPKTAYDRLTEFLAALGITGESEEQPLTRPEEGQA